MIGCTAPFSRHPELVSGSMEQRLGQSPRHGEVGPVGIVRFNEVDLPGAMPALELLFAADRPVHGLEELGMDEAVNAVARGETRTLGGPVLPNAGGEIGRHADIQGSAFLAGENIGARVATSHAPIIAVPWMLKQVQHDGGRAQA